MDFSLHVLNSNIAKFEMCKKISVKFLLPEASKAIIFFYVVYGNITANLPLGCDLNGYKVNTLG